MKIKFILAFVLSLNIAVTSCKDNVASKISDSEMNVVKKANAKLENLPILEFDKVEYNFGNIKEGEKVSTDFIVKNIGKSDLLIISAQGSCGCTVPEPPKAPIKPGQSAPI
ncbi:MAG TPA: hypothetical protein DDZ41_11820, partial [Flavobacterium sp.]|nr:hypothetical protein [Flavobacterium sp.]